MFNLDAQYLRDLVLVDVMTGKTSTILHGHKIGWHSLSPDGRRVACAIPTKFEEPGSFQRLYDLVTVNLATMQDQVLATDILLDDMFSWSPDGSLLAYGAYEANRRSYDYSVVSVTIPG
jgi:Tol biopolymer transport system component